MNTTTNKTGWVLAATLIAITLVTNVVWYMQVQTLLEADQIFGTE